MRATIADNQWIYFDNLTEGEEEVLWKEFSVVAPNVYIDPAQLGHWDGVYRKYNRSKRRIARPLLSMLRGICLEYDLPLVVRDARPPWPFSVLKPDDIGPDFLPGITLDDHQVDAIRRQCLAECGIIDVPTGGGKGEILCGACKAIKCPTVVVADQTVVINQLKTRLELRDVAGEIGLFYAGKRPSGELVVVGSIQSLAPPSSPPKPPKQGVKETEKAFERRLGKWEIKLKAHQTRKKNVKMLRQYVKDAQMVLVDECDKATGDSWKGLFRHCFKGRRRYGYSGTPFDPSKPVQGMVMQEHLGSVIAKTSRARLEKIGRIIACEYWMFSIRGRGLLFWWIGGRWAVVWSSLFVLLV
jgi:hypothetical protein